MKENKSGWQFPKALEIVKCKEGNKEFMKERPARRPFGNTVLICEYPLDGDAIKPAKALDCRSEDLTKPNKEESADVGVWHCGRRCYQILYPE